MKKIILFIFLPVGLIAFGYFIGGRLFSSPANTDTQKQVVVTAPVVPEAEQASKRCPANDKQCEENFIAIEGINKKDLSVCSKLSGVIQKNCVTSIALISKNIGICEKVLIGDAQNQCKDLLYGSQAHDSLNFQICTKIIDQTLRKGCLDYVFYTRHDSAFCSGAGMYKDQCLAIVQGGKEN